MDVKIGTTGDFAGHSHPIHEARGLIAYYPTDYRVVLQLLVGLPFLTAVKLGK